MPQSTWRLSFKAGDLSLLPQSAADRLEAFGEMAGLPPNVVYSADYSLSEYLREVLKRSSPTDVSIEFEAGTELIISVLDDGIGFDPTSIPQSDLSVPINEQPGEDIGMAIMGRLMDRADFAQINGLNRLLMVKDLKGWKLKPNGLNTSAAPLSGASRSIRISIVEDDSDFRNLVANVLNKQPGLQVVDCFGNVASCVASLPNHPVDVILMDIHLPGVSGIQGVRQVLDRAPETLIVMLTTAMQPEPVVESLQAGAVGYIVKGSPAGDIAAAVREAYAGGSPMSSRIARTVVQSFRNRTVQLPAAIPTATNPTPPTPSTLSQREKELLDLLAGGSSYKMAAHQMEVSINTIRCYVRRVYQKLGATTRNEALRNRMIE